MPVHVIGDKLVIRVSYSPDVVNRIKGLPGRKFDPNTKTWSLPIEMLPQLREQLPHLAYGKDCDDAFAAAWERINASTAMEADEEIVLPGGALRPYQVAGVHYLEGLGGRAMIADEMGLGKTVQTIAYLYRNAHIANDQIVVVCPAAVKKQWQREFKRWVGWDATILDGRKPSLQLPVGTPFIVNYDILQFWTATLEPTFLVLDESVAIKERKSKRSEAAQVLAAKAAHVVALSGRPVLNKPYELWNQVQAVRPNDNPLGSWSAFASRYNNYHQSRWGWEMGRAQNLEELERRLRANVMIQRRKTEVLTELPEFNRVSIPLEVDNTEYSEAFDAMEGLEIGEIAELRRLVGLSKVGPAMQWLMEARENLEPFVVFAHHRDVLGTIAGALGAPPPLDGGMPQKERQEWIDRFQAGLEPVLVCGTRAMGVGVNLQAGSNCVFIELDWNMAAHEQAESRLHRMGQKNAVTAYYLIAEGTIDDPMMEILSEKQEVSEKVVGEVPTPRVLERLREALENRG